MTDDTTEQRANGSRVLKTDTRGRVRSRAAQREAVIKEFQRSGLSLARFAEVAGMNYQTFAGWVRKARRQSKAEARSAGRAETQNVPKPHDGVHWVEATPGMELFGEAAAPLLRVRLRGGMELEISAPSQVSLAAALLRTLEGGPVSC